MNEKRERLVIGFMLCSQYHFFAVFFNRKVSFLKQKKMEILVKYNTIYIYIYNTLIHKFIFCQIILGYNSSYMFRPYL